jgi:hypothetical protein
MITRFEYCSKKDCHNMASKVCQSCHKRYCLSHYINHDNCIENKDKTIYGPRRKKNEAGSNSTGNI